MLDGARVGHWLRVYVVGQWWGRGLALGGACVESESQRYQKRELLGYCFMSHPLGGGDEWGWNVRELSGNKEWTWCEE